MLPIGKRKHRNNSIKAFIPLDNKYLTGFTLIELVLVILLISILIGLSTPIFRRTFSNLELKNTTYNISKMINYAEEMAIIDKVNYKINFDFEKGKYWITKGEEKIGGRYGRTFFLPRGLTFTGKREEITLYPDGSSGRAEIKIVDKTGEGYQLQIKGFGSRVQIEEIKK